MIDNVLKFIAPNYCYSCDNIGYVLCDNCKNDIAYEPYVGCIVCVVLRR